jgi:serine/threonine protein kinase
MPPDARLTTALAERYTLESELGQGGMATVYLARDVKHDRQVAVKVLRPELSAILGRERFLAEVRNTARLDHPHILTLLDSGETDGYLWYTLPYIRGESLRHKLDRETQLGVDEAVSITRQIAGALEHAHQHGIIHRDVKPENILLHEGEVMLADFGIALAVKEAGGPRLTETGLSLGTPQYMSPEQATAERTLDARSDVYSLGAVLYEMLAGEPPFTGATGQAVIAKLMVEQPSSLRTVRGTIPPGLEAVVSRALAKVPADRFPSAAAFAAALAAPETHRPPKPLPKRALLLGGAAVVGLVVAGVWLRPKLQSARFDTPRGDPTLTQVTVTGNAHGPALSPDGKQLAYEAETCVTPGDCTSDLVVEDLTLGERKTLARGFRGGWIHRILWSPDQQFLMFLGWRGEHRGPYVISTFGGREEYLGDFNTGGFLGSADTIVVAELGAQMPDGNPSRATRWFLLLSRDGRRLDSIPFAVPGIGPWPIPSPDGRRILIWSFSGDDNVAQSHYLIDRAGRLTDSLPTLHGFHPNRLLQWTASGDGLLALLPAVPAEPGVWTLLRYPVSVEGKVRLPPDTVVKRLQLSGRPDAVNRIALSPPSHNGDQALALVTETRSLTTLERPSLLAAPSRVATRIPAVTGQLFGRIAPDGQQILVGRRALLDNRPAMQLEVWPFAGGGGRPLGPPRQGVRNAAWGADSRVVYLLAAGRAPGQLEHAAIDVASGRVLRTRTVPDSLDWWLSDSLLFYTAVDRRDSTGALNEWKSYPDAGGPPLVFTFSFPDSAEFGMGSIVAPDGRGSWFGVMGTWRASDSVGTIHVASPGLPAKPMVTFKGPWELLDFIHVAPGPVLEAIANTEEGGRRRLLFEPGRPIRDLGPMPIAGVPSLSADGRRGVVVETETRTDIWLLKWPGGDSAGAR